ncbi:MAG TPA: hypothetical protein VG456_24355 [Candidatus Sulfopaludibacter sp.]|jgi:hypothetical protein|nr:hypothetical protein [Candidatus Sulfopaludibacter sp.]
MRTLAGTFFLVTFCALTSAQTPTPSADDLAAQTAALKAQQAYYDQLLATMKSQAAAQTAGVLNATASATLANQLQQAQITGDLAVATAIKGTGLAPATGKQGTIAVAAGTATLLPLQQPSLRAIDAFAGQVCKDLQQKNIKNAFIAPANFEALAEKGTVDLIQLRALHSAAVQGAQEFKTVNLQVAGTALAGALVSIADLAGGIQALSTLFRSDYSVAVTSNTRPNLFEQRLTAACGNDVIVYNQEGILRLNAAKILIAWLPDMTSFAQLYDTMTDRVTSSLASLATQKTAAAADSTSTAAQKKANLDNIDSAVAVLNNQQTTLNRYKSVVASMKSYLSGLSATSSLFDSLVWAQDVLFDLGGTPVGLAAPNLRDRPRFSFTLNVQDATVTKSSTFRANQIKGISSVEAYYAVVDSGGLRTSGVYALTLDTPAFSFGNTPRPSYGSILPLSPVPATPPPN